MLYPPETNHHFFSMCYVDQALTLVLNPLCLSYFPEDVFNYLESNPYDRFWRTLEIGDPSNETGLGFDEPGIVSRFTRPLAREGIQCFYLSTYKSDYVLVPSAASTFGRVIELLK
jgi:hypothetical protein